MTEWEFTCAICGAGFDDRAAFADHLTDVHTSAELDVGWPDVPDAWSEYADFSASPYPHEDE